MYLSPWVHDFLILCVTKRDVHLLYTEIGGWKVPLWSFELWAELASFFMEPHELLRDKGRDFFKNEWSEPAQLRTIFAKDKNQGFKWKSEFRKTWICQRFPIFKTFLIRMVVILINVIFWSWVMKCVNNSKSCITHSTNSFQLTNPRCHKITHL